MNGRNVHRGTVVFLSLYACDKGDTGPTYVDTDPIECGEGTELVDGECVSTVEQIEEIECGEGTTLVDGECVSSVEEIECGEGTTLVDGECVSSVEEIECGEGTHLEGEECVADDVPVVLVPGHYEAPLTLVEKMLGEGNEDHLHIYDIEYRATDHKVFYCSYDFGVLDATDPTNVSYSAELLDADTPRENERDPGCLHVDWHDEIPDYVFTSHRENLDFATYLGAWDLNMDPGDPSDISPVQIYPPLQEDGVSYEGLDYENGLVYVAIHEGGLAIYSFDGTTFTRVGSLAEFDNAWNVVVRDDIAYVSDGYAGVVTVDVSDPELPLVMGRVATNGQALEIQLSGDLAYVAAGANGVVVLDIADPYHPTVIHEVEIESLVMGVAVDSERLYVAAWDDTKVYDLADPTTPALLGAVHIMKDQAYDGDPNERPDITARTLAVTAYGDFMYVGNWWVPYVYEVHPERVAPYIVLPQTVSNIGFGPAKPGETKSTTLKVSNEGTALLTAYDIWVNNEAFTVSPSQIAIEPGASTELTLTWTAIGTEIENATLSIFSDDPNQPVREAWLVGNQPGLGVGSTMPNTTGDLVDGNSWSYAEEGAGTVTLLAYFATY